MSADAHPTSGGLPCYRRNPSRIAIPNGSA